MFYSKYKHFVLFAVIFFCLISTFSPIFASAQTTNSGTLVDLPGSLSSDLGTSAGSLDLTQQAQIVVVMTPSNQSQLEKLANDVQNPASTNYGKVMTDAAFTKTFSPSPANVLAVTTYYKSAGLSLTYQSTSGLVLGFTGTLAQLDTAFATTSELRTTAKGITGRINTSTFKIPATLTGAIQGILGFDQLHTVHNNGTTPTVASDTSKTAVSYSTPANLRNVYNVPSDLTGSGTTVGIVLWAAPNTSDISRWQSANGVKGTVTVLPAGTAASTDDTLRFEANMDVQLVQTAAPGANVRFYVSKTNSYDALATTIQQAIDDNVTAITNSWGGCESTMTTTTINSYHTIFQNAAAKGIPVLFSSGDNGSFDCNTSGSTAKAGFTQFPASDTLVTSVGGTTLQRDGATWTNETAWSCKTTDGSADTTCLQASGGASSGGATVNYTRPTFQSAINPTAEAKFTNKATNTRLQPDISLNADPRSGEKVYYTSSYCTDNCLSGGTSAAAPFLAGILALAAEEKGSSVGGINTFLYQKFSTAGGYDVTSGYTGVSAKTGWDYTTGLGSLKNVGQFISAFIGVDAPAANPYTISSLSPASAQTGGKSFTLTVTGSAFTTSTKIFWNGSVRTTTFVSSSQITTVVAATDLNSSGSIPVTVANAAGDGTQSNALNFTITASCQNTVVTRTDDTNTCGSLRYALQSAGSGGTVTFALSAGQQITLGSTALNIPAGVNVTGICNASGPAITINGRATTASLTLGGNNTLYGLTLVGFGGGGTQMKVNGSSGQVNQTCVKVRAA